MLGRGGNHLFILDFCAGTCIFGEIDNTKRIYCIKLVYSSKYLHDKRTNVLFNNLFSM